MTRIRVPLHFTWLLAGALLVTACASQPPTPQAGDLCVAKAEFQASVEAFREIDPSVASVDDLRTAWVMVQRTFREMRDLAGGLADDRFTEVNQAIDDLRGALDDVPDATSVGDALASLEDDVAAVGAAVDALNDELDCPSTY